MLMNRPGQAGPGPARGHPNLAESPASPPKVPIYDTASAARSRRSRPRSVQASFSIVTGSDHLVLQDWEVYRETFAYIERLGLPKEVTDEILHQRAMCFVLRLTAWSARDCSYRPDLRRGGRGARQYRRRGGIPSGVSRVKPADRTAGPERLRTSVPARPPLSVHSSKAWRRRKSPVFHPKPQLNVFLFRQNRISTGGIGDHVENSGRPPATRCHLADVTDPLSASSLSSRYPAGFAVLPPVNDTPGTK